MVAAAGKTKTEIRDLVMAAAEAEIAKFDSMTTEDEYKSTKFDLLSRKGKYENANMVVTKGTVAGLTKAMH